MPSSLKEQKIISIDLAQKREFSLKKSNVEIRKFSIRSLKVLLYYCVVAFRLNTNGCFS